MERSHRSTAAVLFTCLFAAQAAVIAMTPVLAEAAADLHVTTAAAGQLRTIAGLVAGITALVVGAAAGRVGLARQLLAGCVLLAIGSAASAAAPTFALLAVAQVPVGLAVAVLTSCGTLAAAEWVAPEHRTRVLSWTLVGQPAAWIVGMPLIGVVGERSWRLGWLVLPLTAAVAAGALVMRTRAEPRAATPPSRLLAVLADRDRARWLLSELLANAAWAGTLVYSGALLVESYGVSPRLTGGLLALVAGAYVAGNLASRRLVGREHVRLLVLLAVALAAAVTLFGAVRPGVAASTALLAVAATIAGGRTLISGAFAVGAPPEVRPGLTALRAATMQFGYFAGSTAAGAALAAGGYGALGAVLGLFFLGAAAVLVGRRAPSEAPQPALYRA